MTTVTNVAPVGAAASPEGNPFERAVAVKFSIRRWLGEPYVGKRMKLFHLARLLRDVKLPAGAKIMECGSGDGVFSEWLSRRFPLAEVTGIELDPRECTACEAWARRNHRDRLRFRIGDILQLPEENTFDLVICLDVLEHIQQDVAAVRQMTRALKPGGLLLVHTPSLYYQRFDGTMHTVPPEEANRINPGHVRNGYTPEQMNDLLQSGGLAGVAVYPRHGKWTDVAHNLYRRFERPSFLRPLAIPLVDLLTRLDVVRPSSHGNTVFGMGRKPQ